MTKWSFISGSSLLAALLLAGGAHARAAPTDPETLFRMHYDNALNLYSAEQYDEAIKEFQAAYVVKPRPRLLFNIGQGHRNLGNYKEALRFYLMYQEMEPNPKPGLRAELERYIAQMKQLIGTAEGVAVVVNSDRDESRHVLGSDKPRLDLPVPPPPPADGHGALVVTAPTPKKPLYRRGWLWGAVGGGAAAALVVGLAAGLTAGHSDLVVIHGSLVK